MRRNRDDDKIDSLIRPPRQIYSGFDWSDTERLKPTGEASRDHVLAEQLQPATELR